MRAGQSMYHELTHRLDRLLEQLMSRREVHHVVIAASSIDGEWQWSDATGSADDGTPMAVDTPWFLASITKLHIASITLRLVEQGHIDLGAPIATYLPDGLATGLHVIDGTDYTDGITATHLLGHHSGLPDFLDERPKGRRSLIEDVMTEGDRSWDITDIVRICREDLHPHFPPSDPHAPRSRIRYSDTNFRLLMAMAEHVTGRPEADLHHDLLIEPIGLRHTWLPGQPVPDGAPPPASVWLGDRSIDPHPLALASFGDLYSTAEDVVLFGRALATGSIFDDPGTAGTMWAKFNRFGFPRGLAALRAPTWPIEYGLGAMRFAPSRFISSGMRIPPMIGHTGSTGSWLWWMPRLGVVICGTVDQTTAATVPFRLVPRAVAGLGR